MAWAADTMLGRLRHRRALAGWQHLARRAGRAGETRLDLLRSRALELRRQIDHFVHAADARLERPAARADAAGLPLGTDWDWRPDPWVGRLAVPGLAEAGSATLFGPSVHLFHDCPQQELGLRQRRNPGGTGLPPFGVELEVFAFAGDFLSLVIDLPEAAIAGLGPRHLVRLELQADAECPLGLFARLNLRRGPNVAPVLRHLALGGGARMVDFDLAATLSGGSRIEAAWLDLIFEAPAMNCVTLRDLRISRHPRAAL